MAAASWRISLRQLGKDRSEAEELAGVLQEASPFIHVEGLQAAAPLPRSGSAGVLPAKLTVKERIQRAVAINIGQWHRREFACYGI